MNTKAELEKFILEELLSGARENLHPDEPLFSTGTIDSLGTLRLITFIEERFGVQVSDGEVGEDNFGTLGRLATFIERKQAAAA